MCKSRKFLIGATFISFFGCGMLTLFLGSIMPDLMATRNLTASFGGTLLMSYSLGNLISGLLLGVLCLKFGRKPVILLMSILAYTGVFIFTFDFNPVYLLPVCVLIGLGRGSAISYNTALINLMTDGEPSFQGVLHSIFAFGAIAAPIILMSARNIFSNWQSGFFIMALFGVISTILLAMANVEDNAPEPKSVISNPNQLGFFKEPGFITVSSLLFWYLCCEYAVNGWLVTFVLEKGMSNEFAQSMAALFWLIMFIGRVLCAIASRYIAQKILLLFLGISSFLFFVAMLFSSGKFFVAFTAGMLGLCMSGLSPIIYAGTAPFTNKYPLAMGIIFSIGCLGAMLMPFFVGVLAEFYGFTGGMAAILIAFVVLIIFSIINFRNIDKIKISNP